VCSSGKIIIFAKIEKFRRRGNEGDEETRKRGDEETRGQGDEGTRGRGDEGLGM